MDQTSLWVPGARPAGPSGSTGPAPSTGPAASGLSGLDRAEWLAAQLGRPVRLVFTDNRSSMVSFRERPHQVDLRLHRAFLEAPPAVWDDLADYLTGRRPRGGARSGRAIDAFIAEIRVVRRRPPPRPRPLGRCHDLQGIFDELNAAYFHGASRARITWGAPGTRRRRRSIQLGSYVGDDQLIRVHPCLDQSFVPRYYVAWVVFHEMLHEVFGVGAHAAGRRCLHPPEFVALEESHPDFRRCAVWEREHLPRLLRFRRGR